MLYMVTFTINIAPMLAYIPYMDPMGMFFQLFDVSTCFNLRLLSEDLARRRRDASQLEAALGMRGGLGKCGTWH